MKGRSEKSAEALATTDMGRKAERGRGAGFDVSWQGHAPEAGRPGPMTPEGGEAAGRYRGGDQGLVGRAETGSGRVDLLAQALARGKLQRARQRIRRNGGSPTRSDTGESLLQGQFHPIRYGGVTSALRTGGSRGQKHID